MFRKIIKFGAIGTVGIGVAAFVFPDYFSPIHKVVNVGVAGAQIYYVYKYKKDCPI